MILPEDIAAATRFIDETLADASPEYRRLNRDHAIRMFATWCAFERRNREYRREIAARREQGKRRAA